MDCPENVQYDSLKQLIKENTSSFQTKPVTIPGQGPSNDAWKQLEDEIFSLLKEEHHKVCEFIRIKYAEIGRRLAQLERQLRDPGQRGSSEKQSNQPIQNTKKFAKLVEDTGSVSELIQHLSQFANTNRVAFRKILKKYRKWTGSGNLQLRMNDEVSNQSVDWLRPDFSSELERLATVTSTLSTMSAKRSASRPDSMTSESSQATPAPEASVTQMHDVSLQGSDLKFDAAFFGVPLGHAAGRAIFWIHPDNMAEAEVLLLRHLKYRVARTQKTVAPRNRTHSAVFDNLQRYVQAQGAMTVGQTEDVEGSVASNAALNILRSNEPNAVAIASDLIPVPTKPGLQRSRIITVSRSDLPRCLSQQTSNRASPNVQSRDGKAQSARNGISELRDYLSQHRDVKPLAEVHVTRERYMGFRNSKELGTWAVLDQDITMSPVDTAALGGSPKRNSDNDFAIESPEGHAFPYAVLQFRWEFSRRPEVVRAFETSHLAERVRGFTAEAEAIYTICSPEGMREPLWRPLLHQDIRKVPPPQPKRSFRRNRHGSGTIETSIPITSGPSSTDGPSDSIFSHNQGQSSATSILDSGADTTATTSPRITSKVAFEDREPLKKKRHPKRPLNMQPESAQRYWNEYEDGEEFAEDSGYAIYVTADEPLNFPGTETVSKACSAMYQSLRSGKRRMISWLPLVSHEREDGERRPLLGSQRPSVTDLEDSSDSDSAATSTIRPAKHQSRSLRAASRNVSNGTLRLHKVRSSRETHIFAMYLAAFLVAFGMLILSGILQMTGRHTARIEVDAGVIAGVIVALSCGIGGISLMVYRKEQLSFLHQAAVFLACVIVLAGSGYLLALVGSTG